MGQLPDTPLLGTLGTIFTASGSNSLFRNPTGDELVEHRMSKRKIGFLLIGLGLGLLLAIAGILDVLLSLYRSAFISGYSWDKWIVAVPLLLLIIGLVFLVYGTSTGRNSN